MNQLRMSTTSWPATSSAAGREAAAGLVVRVRAPADRGRAVQVVSHRAAGGLVGEELCGSAEAVAELVGSVGLVLRDLAARVEAVRGEYTAQDRERLVPAGTAGVAALDTALLNLDLGQRALEAVHHLLLTGRAVLWEVVTTHDKAAREKTTREEGGG